MRKWRIKLQNEHRTKTCHDHDDYSILLLLLLQFNLNIYVNWVSFFSVDAKWSCKLLGRKNNPLFLREFVGEKALNERRRIIFLTALLTDFTVWTHLMQHDVTVVCVNDNNPPGLSISTRSLWPARHGEKSALVNRGLWVLQFTVAKITVPSVGHVSTGTAAGRGSVLAGVWWNHTLTQMTRPAAFHLEGESKALVTDKCTVRRHKSTSLRP